jgi:hypothetical protein
VFSIAMHRGGHKGVKRSEEGGKLPFEQCCDYDQEHVINLTRRYWARSGTYKHLQWFVARFLGLGSRVPSEYTLIHVVDGNLRDHMYAIESVWYVLLCDHSLSVICSL